MTAPQGQPAGEPCGRRCRGDETGNMHPECAVRASGDLVALPPLYARLWTMLAPSQGAGARVSGSRDRPIGIRVDVHDLMTDIVDVLRLWSAQMADDRPGELYGPAPRALRRRRQIAVGPSGAARLLERADADADAARVQGVVWWIDAREWWPYRQSWSLDFAEEIRELAHRARKIAQLYDQTSSVMAAPCPRCGRFTLVQDPGEEGAHCIRTDECGSVYRLAEYREWVENYNRSALADGKPSAIERFEILATSAADLAAVPGLRHHSNRLARQADAVLKEEIVATTPASATGLRQYDHHDPRTAVLAAWITPGPSPEWHERSRAQVRQVMPLLGRALDRLAAEAAVAPEEA